MNIFEKAVFTVFVKPAMKMVELEEKIEKNTGFSLTKKLIELDKADEELRHKSPVKWTAKKLAKGTIMGILGASFHND